MATPISQPQSLCKNCGHPESDHGRTGTRPCLAAVGPDRHFCDCDQFVPKPAKAA